MASLYRTTALMATNMQNIVASTGSCASSANSGNALLGVAANLSIPIRVFAGIEFTEDGIKFHPLVPKSWNAKKELTNLKYRKAVLDITVQGYGDKVSACSSRYWDGAR